MKNFRNVEERAVIKIFFLPHVSLGCDSSPPPQRHIYHHYQGHSSAQAHTSSSGTGTTRSHLSQRWFFSGILLSTHPSVVSYNLISFLFTSLDLSFLTGTNISDRSSISDFYRKPLRVRFCYSYEGRLNFHPKTESPTKSSSCGHRVLAPNSWVKVKESGPCINTLTQRLFIETNKSFTHSSELQVCVKITWQNSIQNADP